MTRIRLPLLLPLLLAPVACSDGAPVDLGHGQALISDYAANWDGYAEAYAFPDGSSDRVRIVMDATGEGTLQVGDAALDPTPTDPNVPLPSVPGRFHDGFRYPIHAATVEAGRIRFKIDPGTRWASWCAIQVPYARTESLTGYVCVDLPDDKEFTDKGLTGECTVWQHDPADTDPSNGVTLTNPMPVSCNRYNPCVYGICACTASSCAYDPTVPHPDGLSVDVDGALADDGASLVGTLAIHPDWDHPDVADRLTIRLQRH